MEKKSVMTPENGEQMKYIEQMRAENDATYAATGRRRGAFVLTFGCQQNEADSEKIAGLCEAMGYEVVDAPEAAELIMVNTCAVREHAEDRVFGNVGALKPVKNEKNCWAKYMAVRPEI